MKKTPHRPFNTVEIYASEIDNSDIALADLFSRRKDVLVIKNVLNNHELLSIKENFKNLENDRLMTNTPVGLTFPFTYTDLNHHEIENNAVDKLSLNYNEEFKSIFKLDIESIIENVLKKLIKGKGIAIDKPSIGNTNKKLIPYSFRLIMPYNGSIQLHCESYLYEHYKVHENLLQKDIDLDNGLSYFILVKKPDKGGDLILYNLEWNEIKNNLSDFLTENNFGKTDFKEEYQKYGCSVELNEGDMIIFAASQIWHKIEEIKGLNNRCTIGGFIGEGIGKDVIYYWS